MCNNERIDWIDKKLLSAHNFTGAYEPGKQVKQSNKHKSNSGFQMSNVLEYRYI